MRVVRFARNFGQTAAFAAGFAYARAPLRGPGTASLRVGDRVWFRHAKAGEICEHVNELHTLTGDRLTGAWPTYRGEGKAFG